MKPIFTNKTTYDSRNYNEFVEFHAKKFSTSYNAYNLIMLILLLYCIILNIIQKNILLILLLLAMAALLFLFRIYLPMRKFEKTQEKYKKNKQTTYTISFYKYFFSVGKSNFAYFKLYKIFETDDYFYLYIDEENAVLVSKTGFELGSPEEFTCFIKKKCPLKYKN